MVPRPSAQAKPVAPDLDSDLGTVAVKVMGSDLGTVAVMESDLGTVAVAV